MKYDIESGVQLYHPEGEEETWLVWDRLHDILMMECRHAQLWDWDVKNSRDRCWFPATVVFPITRKLTSLAQHVEDLVGDRVPEPFIFTFDCALPTTYRVEPMVFCRWSPKMGEGDRDLMLDLLNVSFGASFPVKMMHRFARVINDMHKGGPMGRVVDDDEV